MAVKFLEVNAYQDAEGTGSSPSSLIASVEGVDGPATAVGCTLGRNFEEARCSLGY